MIDFLIAVAVALFSVGLVVYIFAVQLGLVRFG